MPVNILMQSLSYRSLPDTFLGFGGQEPIVQMRLNMCVDKSVSTYHVSLTATHSASGLPKTPSACNFLQFSNFSTAIVSEVDYHCGNNTPEPLTVPRQEFGALWRRRTARHRVEVRYNISWLCGKPELSFNLKRKLRELTIL